MKNLFEAVPLRNYVISGPDQIRPTDFVKELKNSKFKEALVNCLTK